MSALDLDAVEALLAELAVAKAQIAPSVDAFEEARETCLAAGGFGVWGRDPNPAEAAALEAHRTAVNAKHAAEERLRLARIAWRRVTGSEEALAADLITRLRAAEARTAWQPIETAPADVEVIVRVKTGSVWRVREAVGSVDRLGWIWRTSDGTAVDARHWAPIPAAPEAS